MSEVSAASQTGIWLMFSPTIFSASAKNIYILNPMRCYIDWFCTFRMTGKWTTPAALQWFSKSVACKTPPKKTKLNSWMLRKRRQSVESVSCPLHRIHPFFCFSVSVWPSLCSLSLCVCSTLSLSPRQKGYMSMCICVWQRSKVKKAQTEVAWFSNNVAFRSSTHISRFLSLPHIPFCFHEQMLQVHISYLWNAPCLIYNLLCCLFFTE